MSNIPSSAQSKEYPTKIAPPFSQEPKVTQEPVTKRRSVTSPATLESLPLPKSSKKSPVRTRASNQYFNSGDWTFKRPQNAEKSIEASFTQGADQLSRSTRRSSPVDAETLIDKALLLVQDIEKNQSI